MERKNKTMSYFEYFLKHIPLAAWLSFMYYMILFVNIPGVTVDMSKVVYFVGIQLLWLLLSVATPAKRRSKQNAVFDVVLSYIPYLMITYLPVYKHILIPFIIVTVVLCAIYFAIVLSKKVKNKRNFKKVIKSRTRFALNGTKAIAGALAVVLLSFFYLSSVFGVKLIKSEIPVLKSANVEDAEQWTIKNNMDSLRLLQEKEWRKLSVDEKLEVLSVVRNIETSYLGLSYEVYLTVKPTNDVVWGYYDHKEHTVVLNNELLSSGEAEECLHTLCHEMYHAYQNNQVELYQTVDERYKNMAMFSAARAYEEEFADYISGEDDYFEYLLQDTERTADLYADEAVEDYYAKLEAYLEKEKKA